MIYPGTHTSRSSHHARQRPFNAKSWHCRDLSCNQWPRTRSPTRPANVPNARQPSRTSSPSCRSGARQARPQTSPCSAHCRTRHGTTPGTPFFLSPTPTNPQPHHTLLHRKHTPSTPGTDGRTRWRSTSACTYASRRSDGRNTPAAVTEPRRAVPRGAAVNRPGTRAMGSPLAGGEPSAKYLLLYLTCAQRKHGSRFCSSPGPLAGGPLHGQHEARA